MENKEQEINVAKINSEYQELAERLIKSLEFIDSEKFNELPDELKGLLKVRAEITNQYLRIRECRIADALNKNIDAIGQLSFGTVISALNVGFLAYRKGWNGKGLFVFKQVRVTIAKDEIIKNMLSLNDLSKQLILATKGFINYCNQCLIYDTNTGNANNWVPSISDIFAEDWCIVTKIDMAKIGNNK